MVWAPWLVLRSAMRWGQCWARVMVLWELACRADSSGRWVSQCTTRAEHSAPSLERRGRSALDARWLRCVLTSDDAITVSEPRGFPRHAPCTPVTLSPALGRIKP